MDIRILKIEPADEIGQPKLKAYVDFDVDGTVYRGFRLVDLKSGLTACCPGKAFYDRDGAKRFIELVTFPEHVQAAVSDAVIEAYQNAG